MAHRIPALRLHRPTGQAVVTLSGRDFYLGRHGTKRARDRYDQLVDQWLKNGRTLPQTLRVNELIVSYVRDHVETYYRKDGEPTSRQHVIPLALRRVRQIFGRENAAEFGPAKLRECRDWMIEAGWAITIINDAVHEVRKIIRTEWLYAVLRWLEGRDRYHGFRTHSGESPVPGVNRLQYERAERAVRKLGLDASDNALARSAGGNRTAVIKAIKDIRIRRSQA